MCAFQDLTSTSIFHDQVKGLLCLYDFKQFHCRDRKKKVKSKTSIMTIMCMHKSDTAQINDLLFKFFMNCQLYWIMYTDFYCNTCTKDCLQIHHLQKANKSQQLHSNLRKHATCSYYSWAVSSKGDTTPALPVEDPPIEGEGTTSAQLKF